MKITRYVAVVAFWYLCAGQALAMPAQLTPLAFKSLMTDIASVDGQVIAVGEQGHILFSNDGGANWAQADVPVDNLLTSVFMLDKNTAWAVGHDGVVLRSDNGGRSWQLVYSLLEQSGADFVDPLLDVLFWDVHNGVAVGAFGQLYRSNDGGRSWENQSDALGNEDELHLNAVIRTPGKELWIASEYGIAFRSTDGGAQWEAIQFPTDGTFFTLAYQPSHNAVIVAGITGTAYGFALDDAEITSVGLETSQSIYDVLISDTSRHFVGANGVWLFGHTAHNDKGRVGRHAITESAPGMFAIATAQGVELRDGKGLAQSLRFIEKEVER